MKKTKLDSAFDNYTKNYDLKDNKVYIKYYHSYRVKELMKDLAIKLELTEKQIEVSEVIGLLHDIGRFEQLKKYQSFSDIKSGFDHADESCIYLFDQGHIKDFYDNEDYFEIIKDSIKNHNKYVIDKKLSGDNLFYSKMIRDMDKVDIFRVIYEFYKYDFDKNEISKEVLDSFNNKKPIDRKCLKTKSDFILSLLAFVYDINFKETYIILKNKKYLQKVFSIITPINDSKDELNNIINEINNYIDKKIETI
jgi:hypothetical protein